MTEKLGILVARLVGHRIADALMDGVATVAAFRWASLSLFVTLGPDEEERR